MRLGGWHQDGYSSGSMFGTHSTHPSSGSMFGSMFGTHPLPELTTLLPLTSTLLPAPWLIDQLALTTHRCMPVVQADLVPVMGIRPSGSNMHPPPLISLDQPQVAGEWCDLLTAVCLGMNTDVIVIIIIIIKVVMVKHLLFAHSIPGLSRPMGRPHFTWMDTAMHDMGSAGHTLQIDLPLAWTNLALYRDVWRVVISRC